MFLFKVKQTTCLSEHKKRSCRQSYEIAYDVNKHKETQKLTQQLAHSQVKNKKNLIIYQTGEWFQQDKIKHYPGNKRAAVR